MGFCFCIISILLSFLFFDTNNSVVGFVKCLEQSMWIVGCPGILSCKFLYFAWTILAWYILKFNFIQNNSLCIDTYQASLVMTKVRWIGLGHAKLYKWPIRTIPAFEMKHRQGWGEEEGKRKIERGGREEGMARKVVKDSSRSPELYPLERG